MPPTGPAHQRLICPERRSLSPPSPLGNFIGEGHRPFRAVKKVGLRRAPPGVFGEEAFVEIRTLNAEVRVFLDRLSLPLLLLLAVRLPLNHGPSQQDQQDKDNDPKLHAHSKADGRDVLSVKRVENLTRPNDLEDKERRITRVLRIDFAAGH
jgi:hypothetical protein